MAPGEVFGLKNGELVMAGVLGGDYEDNLVLSSLLRKSRGQCPLKSETSTTVYFHFVLLQWLRGNISNPTVGTILPGIGTGCTPLLQCLG